MNADVPAEFEVAMTSLQWNEVMRPMSTDATLIAHGELRRGDSQIAPTLVVEDLKVDRESPRGEDFAPLASWIVISMPDGELPQAPDEWITRLQPRYAQLCVVLLIGFGTARSGWCGWAIERGVTRPLCGFRIVGTGMVRILRTGRFPENYEVHPERWTRTVRAVGERTYSRVRGSSVVLIGCSRSGTLAATMLAALGVQRIALIDGDQIELHNLDGMVLAKESDVGMNKAVSLGRRLVEFRSDLAVSASTRSFGSTYDQPSIGDADLIVTCVDEDGPRMRVARMARKNLIPHLDIGSAVTSSQDQKRQLAADVRLLLPGAGCVCCVGGLGNFEQAEFENWAPPGSLSPWAPEPWDARGRLGSLITVNSMAVSTGLQSWLDLLAGQLGGSIWHRIRWEHGKSWVVDSALVASAENCSICGQKTPQRGRS